MWPLVGGGVGGLLFILVLLALLVARRRQKLKAEGDRKKATETLERRTRAGKWISLRVEN